MIETCNENMGGVDLMNKNVNRHRVCIKGKKWWWSLFTWRLNVTVHNAWQLQKLNKGEGTQEDFRGDIAMSYLMKFGTAQKAPGRKPQQNSFRSPRYDGRYYLVENVPDNKKRCAQEGCKLIIRTQCNKCNVCLCISCFVGYHTE